MLNKKKLLLMLTGTLLVTVFFNGRILAAPVFSDIQGNWAQESIQALVDKGVLNGYPDGTFKPDQPVTRAEFAKMVAKTFGYEPESTLQFPDVTGHWASSYINTVAARKIMNAFSGNSFLPDQAINRAQGATMLCRILHVATREEKFSESWPASFTDLPQKHWGFRYVEIARQLELLPPGYQTVYHPEQPATRAEAVWMLRSLNKLEVTKGKIAQTTPDTGLVTVQNQNGGDPLLAMLTPETILLRNNATSPMDSLVTGDEVTVIASPDGNVRYLKAFGRVTKNDLLSRISSMTKGNLTPDQISAIAAGDWESVKGDMKGELYNRLIAMGLTPEESESIMVQDWNYLDTLSRDRLAQALAGQFGITQEFGEALLTRDLQKIKEYGRIELATAALGKLLGTPKAEEDPSY